MQTLNESTLRSYLTANPAARVFYLVGNDPYLMGVCRRLIREAFSAASAEIFDAEKLDRDRLAEMLCGMSLIPEGRVAVVENALPTRISEQNAAFIRELAGEVSDGAALVLCALYEEQRFSASKKVIALLPEDAALVLVEKKQGAELERIVRAFAGNAGCAIEPAAVKSLISLCGNDLARLKNELEKAAAFVNYATVTAAAVEKMVSDGVETNVFDMVRAISANDRRRAMDTLCAMLAERREPISIGAVLISSYANIYRAFLARRAGLSLDGFCAEFGFKPAEAKARIAYEQAASYTEGRLRRIIGILYKLDGDLKSSRGDHALEVETAVSEIML